MTAVQCTECSRPLGDNAILCRTCVDTLCEQLLMVPALLAELTVTRAGQGRSGPATAGRPAETPLPIRVRGRRSFPGQSAVQRLETTVIGWARLIGEEQGVVPAVHTAYLVDITQAQRLTLRAQQTRDHAPDAAALAEPVSALEQAAVWLAHQRRDIARHEAANELANDVRGAVGALAAVIWPANRQYLGLCTTKDARTLELCGQELHAEVGATYVRCRRCRWQYDVADLKAEVLAGADDRLYRLADILRVLDEFGCRVPRTTLYRWARLGDLAPRGWEHRDEHGTRITDHRIGERDAQVYRLGDARRLAARERREGGSAA